MQTKTISSLYSVIILVIILILPSIAHAQPGDPGGDPAPIDGGVSIVAAACAGYLIKRKRKANERKNENCK